MIDIYSRYIVGVRVHPHESGLLAVDMMRQVFGLHGVPQVVHADSEYGRAGVPGFLDSHADGPVRMLVSRLPRAS